MIFLFIFVLSLIPMIKNKIIFNKFASSTWLGINVASTMNSLKNKQCLYQIINIDEYEKYKKKYNREINFPTARAKSGHAHRNSVSQIVLSDRCLKLALIEIGNNPIQYIKGRFIAAFVSHSKFAFEYIYHNPINFSLNQLKIFLDENLLLKRIKQLSIFSLMIFFYLYFIIKFFVKNKDSKPQKLIFIIFLFCNFVGHAFNGYEQERFMYQFTIIYIIFLLEIFEKLNSKKIIKINF